MNRDDGVYGVEVHQTTQRLLAQGLPEAAFFRGEDAWLPQRRSLRGKELATHILEEARGSAVTEVILTVEGTCITYVIIVVGGR